MTEIAQIILTLGIAVAIVVCAFKGNLAFVIGRPQPQEGTSAANRSVLRERRLIAIVVTSAVPGLLNLLSRLV